MLSQSQSQQCRTSQTNPTIFSLQMFFMSNNFTGEGIASLTVKLMNEKKKQIKKICSNDSTEIIKVEILGFSVTSNKMWDISCNLMAW